MNTQTDTLQTYALDPAHSRVGFSVRHMGFTRVHGTFEQFEGTVQVDPDDLTTLRAEGTIQAASITTREPNRDAHLRSGDFLLVDEHPEITFETTGVSRVSGSQFTLTGTLTMRGVSKAITLEGEWIGLVQDPWGGTRLALEAKTKINRKDFGVSFNQVLEAGNLLVGEQVEITLDVQAVRQDADA